MKKILLFCLLVITSFFSSAYANDSADDEVDDNNADKKQIYHLSEDVDLVPTVKVEYGVPRIVIKEVYPVLISNSADENVDQFNQLVDYVIKEEVSRFTQDVKTNQAMQANMKKSAIKNDFTIDFDTSVVSTNKNPIISIRFTIQTHIAGIAHSTHYHRVLNYDLHSGEQLELTDLFLPDSDYLTVISDYSKNSLSKRLKNQDKIADGAAANVDNFKNWNINPHGLLITFDQSQAAPSIHGTQSIIIPYSVLKDVLVPKTALSNCLSHRKRCLQNTLLTGGFIDEAANTAGTNARNRVFNPVLRQS